jgi:hypothetical protein
MNSNPNASSNIPAGTLVAAPQFVYFVAYIFQSPDGVGHGNNSITRPLPITSIEDIQGIQESLKEAMPYVSKVIVQNWQLLRMEEASALEPTPNTVSTSEGPFTVTYSDHVRAYTRIPTFAKACELAEANAREGSGQAYFVVNAAGNRVAGYLRPDACHSMFEASLDEPPNGASYLSQYLKDNTESTWEPKSREELVALLRERALSVAKAPHIETVVGIREFKVDKSNRMFDMSPPYQVVFHQFDGKFILGDNLPTDVYEALQQVLA